MSSTQKAALSTSQTAALNTAQLAALPKSTPLMLDLDGNGIQSLALDVGVRFDLDADGDHDRVGWVGAGDALLVRDLNHNGLIDNGRELFGSATLLADGDLAFDGFQALASLDSDGDGWVRANDKAFDTLMLWRDDNANGEVDAGELTSLQVHGIVGIQTQSQSIDQHQEGNWIGLTAQFERIDGSVGDVADVWLDTAPLPLDDRNPEQQVTALAAALSNYLVTQGPSASALASSGLDSFKVTAAQQGASLVDGESLRMRMHAHAIQDYRATYQLTEAVSDLSNTEGINHEPLAIAVTPHSDRSETQLNALKPGMGSITARGMTDTVAPELTIQRRSDHKFR